VANDFVCYCKYFFGVGIDVLTAQSIVFVYLVILSTIIVFEGSFCNGEVVHADAICYTHIVDLHFF